MIKNTKRIFIHLLAVLLVLTAITPIANAKVPEYNGGVMDEYEYEEVFFLAGYPIKFTGKATVT